MNAEKELLLALLIEKYGEKPVATPKPGAVGQILGMKKHKQPRPKRKITVHSWTDADNELLLHYHKMGHSFKTIAYKMTRTRTVLGNPVVFRPEQCRSQYHNLQVKLKENENG